MEIQLQELIDQIKKNGVTAAEAEAASILEKANAEAEKIISAAKSEADAILNRAKEENSRLVRVSEDAIRQAGRNLLISFRDSVSKELDAIVGDKVEAVYSSDMLPELIVKVVESWTKNAESDDIAVLLNAEDLAKLEGTLRSALKEKLTADITLKPNDNFDSGFRISVNGGRAYYDYSSEAVTEMLSAYLNPKVTALMKEAEGV